MDGSSIRRLLGSWMCAVVVVGSDVPLGTAGSQTGLLVVRVRIANGAMHKVRVKPSDTIKAVSLSAGEQGPLYRDARCSTMMDETQSVTQAGLSQGDVLYAKPRVAHVEERWEPYPTLSKRRRRFRSSARVKTLKDLAAEMHELNAEAERVCREARVDVSAIEAFASASAQSSGSWSVFGRRLLEDGAVECTVVCPESLPFAAELAAKLGLEPVGCAFVADKVGSFVASKSAAAQVEAMRRLGHSGTFPFVTLIVSQDDQGAVEAFEISDVFVQIVAENLVVENHDDDDFIQLSAPAIVDKRETKTFDTAWVYRPVPIVSTQSDFKTSVYDDTPDRTVIAAALGPHLDDRRALAARCTDFALLLRLRHLLTRADFELLCATIRSKRSGAADHLPANFVAVIKRIIRDPATIADNSDADKHKRQPPLSSTRRRRKP